MKKILIALAMIITVVLLLKLGLGFNNISHKTQTLPLSLKNTISFIKQENRKLYLEVYDEDSKLKRTIYLDDTKQELTIPTNICKVNNDKLLIAVGNYDEKPIKIFMYNAKDGLIENYGKILASNPNVLIVSNRLFSYRTEVGNYWIDEYNLDDLNTKVKSIKIPDAPKKILFSEYNNSLYFLFVGGTPVSSVGIYSFNSETLTTESLDEKSFAGDIVVDGGKAYISMSGYSSDGKDNIDDNRILVLNENLKQERVIITSKSPNLILINGFDMYVTVGRQGVTVEKMDLKSDKLINNFPLSSSGTPLATELINNRLFILDSENLYTIDKNGKDGKSILSGKTMSLW